MNITRESVNATEVTLNIEMAPDDEEPFIARSYRVLVSRVRIPGFRPGKAPRSIVESHLGRSALVTEALDFMLPETLERVLEQENLQAFMDPQLEILGTEPVSFKAIVPLEPVVDLGDFRSIRLERQPVEIADDQVNSVIEQMRYEAAPWEPVERPLKFGDLLTLDVEGTIAGEQAIHDQGIDFIAQQDNPLPVPGFSIYLEGMSEGQEKEFTLTVPEDHHQANYAGKECRLQVRVLSVKEKSFPELDDEFAKGVRDGFESLEALGRHVRQQLTEAAEISSRRQLEHDGLEELLKLTTIEASGLIHQQELDRLYKEREGAVRDRRLDMDTYLRYIGKTEEEWRELLRPQAEERLNTYLVLRKLAQEEGIEVSSEEMQAEIDAMVSESSDSEESMRRALTSDHAQDSIRTLLLNRKVIGRLAEIVQGQSQESGTPDADAAANAGSVEADGSPQQEEPVQARTVEPKGDEEGTNPDAD